MSAPGWHPDPGGSGQQRYFDGREWTQHFAPSAGPPPPPPPVPPKKGMGAGRILLIVGAVLVALLVVAGIAGNSGDDADTSSSTSTSASRQPSSATAAPTAVPSSAPSTAPSEDDGGTGSQITYEVQSDGPLSTVSYFDALNDMTQVADQPSTWSTSFEGKATYQMHSLSAQTQGTQVSCKITVDGTVIAEEEATGRYAVVVCSG